jgi:hypothetical protein
MKKLFYSVLALIFFVSNVYSYSSLLIPDKKAPKLSYAGDQSNIEYLNGMEAITSHKKNTSVSVIISNLGKVIVAKLAVRSNEGSFNFSPIDNAVLMYVNKKGETITAKQFTPEEIMEDIDKQARSYARKQRAAAFGAVLSNAASSYGGQTYTVKDNMGRTTGTVNYNNSAQVNAANQQAAGMANANAAANYNDAANYANIVNAGLFKKSTIYKGQIIVGDIIFEANKKAQKYILNVATNGENHEFIFDVKRK